jgi:hypothetical protein
MASSTEAELARNQSKRAGEDTTATPVNSASVQTYESPAMAAVLQTKEFLHLIISEVPRELRTSLRRVSKAWQAAVEKIGHAFEPEGYAVCEGQGPCRCHSSPFTHRTSLFESIRHCARRVPAMATPVLRPALVQVKQTIIGSSGSDSLERHMKVGVILRGLPGTSTNSSQALP